MGDLIDRTNLFLTALMPFLTILIGIMTLYIVLNQMVYLYVIAFTSLGQFLYWIYKPFGPEPKRKTQQETTAQKTTAQLNNQINQLGDTIKVQRSMIEVLTEVNTKLRESVEKGNTT